MRQKYLPIGSICTLKGKNKKVMIIGYYTSEFNGNLKINDYYACVYPEGTLLPNKICTFNHEDIENIDFIGFENEEYKILKNHLDRLINVDKSEEEKARDFHNDNEMFLTSNNIYSKLLFDENGVVMIADPLENSNEDNGPKKIEKIEFDENGTVVSANIPNPFYKEYGNNEIEETKDTTKWNIFDKIEFDENGVVLEASSVDFEDKSSLLNKIEFDENGVVVAINGDSLKEEKKYSFDENGIVLSIGEDKEEIPPIGPGLPGYVAPKNESKIEFDENGVVVSE